jgi:hypothetical protein
MQYPVFAWHQVRPLTQSYLIGHKIGNGTQHPLEYGHFALTKYTKDKDEPHRIQVLLLLYKQR